VKADTARKAISRLAIVLRHAAALGLDVDVQATEKAKALLGKTRHVAKNIPAMAWRDAPAFYASLEEPTQTHLALRLMVLTVVRSSPLRNLQLDQIEGEFRTVPAEARTAMAQEARTRRSLPFVQAIFAEGGPAGRLVDRAGPRAQPLSVSRGFVDRLR
jgi:integrase